MRKSNNALIDELLRTQMVLESKGSRLTEKQEAFLKALIIKQASILEKNENIKSALANAGTNIIKAYGNDYINTSPRTVQQTGYQKGVELANAKPKTEKTNSSRNNKKHTFTISIAPDAYKN